MTLISEQKQIALNEKLVMKILQELILCGVKDICVCPSKRNGPFVSALDKINLFKTYFWPEERSAAFFALGRSKLTHQPTAVITSSGTAVGELLPAAMEAYYLGIPLILITADRPRSFRGTNAPQTAEQVGLFGQYAIYENDIENDEDEYSLKEWQRNGPAHINICLGEPLTQKFEDVPPLINQNPYTLSKSGSSESAKLSLDQFSHKSRYPLVVVSALEKRDRDPVAHFLQEYKAPVYLEGVSGLREDARLSHLRITRTDDIWKHAEKAGYPIDGILRIGGIPTFRLWRDLEDLQDKIQICNISARPYSGLYWASVHCTSLSVFFEQYTLKHQANADSANWIHADRVYHQNLLGLFDEEPLSEAVLIYQLSAQIPKESFIFLGNSLPIREWDSFATSKCEHSAVLASRGLSGIDGQISTFLGMCETHAPNWGIIGDLTAIYDLAGPWILDQMREISLNLVIINNGGGKIFERMFPLKQFQNPHHIKFKPLAELWNMHYECYHQIPEKLPYGGHRLLEIIPNEESTLRFWNKIGKI